MKPNTKISIMAALTFAGAMATAPLSQAAALPPLTLLGLDPGQGSAVNTPCTSGSCFGLDTGAGFILWADIAPGTDGGIVVGKSQASGGQETSLSGSNSTPGELTAAWVLNGFGTFYTQPDGATKNIFDDTSCAKESCNGKTEIKLWNVATNGSSTLIGMSQGYECPFIECFGINDYKIDLVSGRWSLDYKGNIPAFDRTVLLLHLTGSVSVPRVLATVNLKITTTSTTLTTWKPLVSNPNGLPITCRIGSPTANGTASVASDCSTGSYQSNTGFAGTDSFTYTANDGQTGSEATVSVVVAPIPSPTPLPSPIPGSQLPPGTLLPIVKGAGSTINLPCSTGSCFALELSPGFITWIDIAPGTDGGFIVGKAQKCGGQETGPSSTNATSGELTAAWNLGSRYGTFCTDPGGELNLFGNTSCLKADCLRRTELRFLYFARDGLKVPLGSSNGCNHVNCSPDQKAGIFVDSYTLVDPSTWQMQYSQVVPEGPFTGVLFKAIFRGMSPSPVVLEAKPVTVSGTSAQSIVWTPLYTITGTTLAPTCTIATAAQNGTAGVMADCSSGTYQSSPGFVGTDSFVYRVTACTSPSGPCYGANATVTVSVTDGTVDQLCVKNNPVSQFTHTGKQGTITIGFTGNITSHTNKEVKICPGTKLSYQTTSTQGPVVCRLKNNLSSGTGSLRINDQLKCTDKPAGKDKVHFKVKSGVK